MKTIAEQAAQWVAGVDAEGLLVTLVKKEPSPCYLIFLSDNPTNPHSGVPNTLMDVPHSFSDMTWNGYNPEEDPSVQLIEGKPGHIAGLYWVDPDFWTSVQKLVASRQRRRELSAEFDHKVSEEVANDAEVIAAREILAEKEQAKRAEREEMRDAYIYVVDDKEL